MISSYDDYIKDIENGKKEELSDAENLYGGISDDYEEEYDNQIAEIDAHAQAQEELQKKSTDFTIDQLKDQKEEARKDYVKEQTAAYTDYQKQVDPYGVNAEQMATNGFVGSGYSESSKVSMYKAYQNRVSVARETYRKATIEFDNAMTQARLQNDAALAEIAYDTFRKKLELTIQKLQTKNSLLLELADKKASINSTYNSLYLDVLEKKTEEEESLIGVDTEEASIDEDNTDSDLLIDKKSMMALGYGMLNATELDRLIRKGDVVEYVENGILKYRRNRWNPFIGMVR